MYWSNRCLFIYIFMFLSDSKILRIYSCNTVYIICADLKFIPDPNICVYENECNRHWNITAKFVSQPLKKYILPLSAGYLLTVDVLIWTCERGPELSCGIDEAPLLAANGCRAKWAMSSHSGCWVWPSPSVQTCDSRTPNW